ncbi:tRNA(Met) cytidine acetyltransferase TmcA [Methanopyrus sp.]
MGERVEVCFDEALLDHADVDEVVLDVGEEALAEALAHRHRRMIVFEGDELKAAAAGAVAAGAADVLSEVRDRPVSVLYVTDSLKEGTYARERYEEFRDVFEGFLEEVGVDYELEALTFGRSKRVLGTTWDILVMDLSYELDPDAIGRLIETVRGGGLVLLLTPPFERWRRMWTAFHKSLVTPPYTLDHVGKRFNRRFIRKLEEHDGIWIVNTDEWEARPEPREEPELEVEVKRREAPDVEPPERAMLPEEVYRMCATEDQFKALTRFEELLRARSKTALILTADRGRGKSALLGLAIAGAGTVSEDVYDVVVTASEPENVGVLFEFLLKALDRLGVEYEFEEDEDGNVVYVETDEFVVEYERPSDAAEIECDLMVVDEAASIHVPILHRILDNNDLVVYSSTIHGYEGAGRGFSVRFLQSVERRDDVRLIKFKMHEPIRYDPDDPIERWLFDTLLLDAEPAELDEEDLECVRRQRVRLEKPDLRFWFEDEEGEEELRQFIGIYVMAHYRNRPSDVMVLADAPHHEAYALKTETGKIVTALQVAREGSIPRDVIVKMRKGYRPPGNVIPDLMVQHHDALEFPRMKGYRIVRIATHPDVMRQGLGSRALEELAKVCEEKDFDWIGTGFGANEELTRFWLKNDFVPVHISPNRNPVSGEYSVAVIRPISDEAREIIQRANFEFRLKLVDWLGETHRDLEPEVARLLLTPMSPHRYRPALTDGQLRRLKKYVDMVHTYEIAADAIRELVKTHFLDTEDRLELSREEELLLVTKCLQRWEWEKVANFLDEEVPDLMRTLRDLIGLLYEEYKEELGRHSALEGVGKAVERLAEKGHSGEVIVRVEEGEPKEVVIRREERFEL